MREVSRFAFHLSQPKARKEIGLKTVTAAKYSSHASPGRKALLSRLNISKAGHPTIQTSAGSRNNFRRWICFTDGSPEQRESGKLQEIHKVTRPLAIIREFLQTGAEICHRTANQR